MIRVDISRMAKAVIGTVPRPGVAKRIAGHIGSAARAEWIRLARGELKTTLSDYIGSGDVGLQEPKIASGGKKVTLELRGAVPNMVEQGWPGGDQRAFLAVMGAPKARRSKKGHWYNVVPFRHGTPGTSGKNVGKPMPARLYQEVASMEKFPAAMRFLLNHKKLVDPEVKKILEKKLNDWHASGQYEGLVKTGGGYFTFRVISQASHRGWIHPGIRARHLAKKVQQFVLTTAPVLLREMEL